MRMKVKERKNVIGLFLKINLSTSMSMNKSRRELSTDMVIRRGIFKDIQITIFPCFNLRPKSGVKLSLTVRRFRECESGRKGET